MRKMVFMKRQVAAIRKDIGKMAVFRRIILLGTLIILNPAPVLSSESPWAFSLGAGAYTTNVYYGSDELYVNAVPLANTAYTRERFSASFSLLDGIGMRVTDSRNRFFANININAGDERDSKEYNALWMSKDHSAEVKSLLEGSPTVKTSVRTELMLGYMGCLGNFGVSLEYHPTTLEGKRDRSYNGFLSYLSYSKPFAVTDHLSVTGMLSLGVMDRNYARAWYTVENPTRRLETFDADAGLRDVRVAVQIVYMVLPDVGITFLSGNSILLMDAGKSPYTASKYQMTSGLFGFYTF